MVWTIRYIEGAKKELKKLDKGTSRRIVEYMENHVAKLDDARSLGKALTGNMGTYWRYRVGDYRVFCDIRDAEVVVLVLRIGHRREIYGS